MPNTKNVMTGAPTGAVGGYLLRAPLGTALPTTEASALNAGFIDQGYVSEDGVERAISKTYEVIRDMGGNEVLKSRTEHGVTVTFALLETLNGEVAKTIYGTDAVTITAANAGAGTKVAIAYAGAEVPNSSWVLDTKLADKIKRYVFPNAQLATEDQTVTLNSSTATTFPVSLTLYPDAAGKYFYEYSDDGVKSA